MLYPPKCLSQKILSTLFISHECFATKCLFPYDDELNSTSTTAIRSNNAQIHDIHFEGRSPASPNSVLLDFADHHSSLFPESELGVYKTVPPPRELVEPLQASYGTLPTPNSHSRLSGSDPMLANQEIQLHSSKFPVSQNCLSSSSSIREF